MIPDNIILKYQNFNNPFRKLFSNDKEFVGCDFSDYVPSWKMEISENCPDYLIKKAIEQAEEKGYYGFYILIPEKSYDHYLKKLNQIKSEYLLSIEEKISENEKPINLLFWDWIFENISYSEKTLVIFCFLPQKNRK